MSEKKIDEPVRLTDVPPAETWIDLEYPVKDENGGMVTRVRIRRATGVEVSKFFSALDGTNGYLLPAPVIQCSIHVWALIDADDSERIERVAIGFLPRRLRALMEPPDSIPPTGEQPSPSSPTS